MKVSNAKVAGRYVYVNFESDEGLGFSLTVDTAKDVDEGLAAVYWPERQGKDGKRYGMLTAPASTRNALNRMAREAAKRVTAPAVPAAESGS